MKPNNRLMRASGVLLVLTLITSCFVSGTFAKYVSGAEAADSARVARWGVIVTNGNDQDDQGIYSGDAFSTVYHGTVTSSVQSADGSRVIAPGTSGEFETLKISGTPEVAVAIETQVDVTLTGNWEDGEGNFYCPLQFTINGTSQTIEADSAAEFEEMLETMLAGYASTSADQPIPAGTDLSEGSSSNPLPVLLRKDVSLEWEWPYYISEENDQKDTYLGDIAAGLYEDDDKTAPDLKIEFSTTVTQVD